MLVLKNLKGCPGLNEWMKMEGWAKIVDTVRIVLSEADTLARAEDTLTRRLTTPMRDQITENKQDDQEPTTELHKTARRILFMVSSKSAKEALKKGELTGPGLFRAESLVWTTGEARKEPLEELVNTHLDEDSVAMQVATPVVMPTE